jgi:hypothetical protein|tara:strand:+ start:1025 stop:1429 length:405 start_codon:yes stop_codon:yes gene_type:complete
VNETGFIKKVNRSLSTNIYKWKINDPYHGGVPDVYYSGPAGMCFVEYKYKPKLPARPSSKLDFGLSKQQELWLTNQVKNQVSVYVLAGCEDKVVKVSNNFAKVNEYTKETFLEDAMEFEQAVFLLNTRLGGTDE